MTARRPPFSVTGGVKPWIKKFNVTSSEDTFLNQFVGTSDARIVEISEVSGGGDATYVSTSLGSNHTKDWPDLTEFVELPQPGRPRGILRLAILPFNTKDENLPPLSWNGFQQHLDLLHLRNSYLYDENMQTPPSWFEVPLEGGLKGFILKPERWDSNLANFSLSVACCPGSRTTNIVARMLHKADVEHLLSRLQKLRSIAWHPLLVPLILMERRMEATAKELISVRDSLYAVERRIGTHKNYHGRKQHKKLHFHDYGDKVWEQRNKGDIAFETAPGTLTSIVSECAMFEAKCLIIEDTLDWLQGLNAALCEPDTNAALSAVSADSIRLKISTMKTWCGNNRTRSVYLAKRAEAQMQACFNLMAQRDNALNLKTTEAAIRDSSDMRAIAWVTLAFLPATFVATFFSTSFFSFGQDGRRVSNLVWIYCVVSLFLTISVLVGWAWWIRRESRNEK